MSNPNDTQPETKGPEHWEVRYQFRDAVKARLAQLVVERNKLDLAIETIQYYMLDDLEDPSPF